MEAWRQELYHHGILGMKWGRRQGPPYPLDAQDHSAAEKKAGWRKSLDGGSGQESKPKKKLTNDHPVGSIKNGSDEKQVKTPSEKTNPKLQRNADKAKEYANKAMEQRKQLSDLQSNGLNSETLRKQYGKALDMNNVAFYLYYGKSKDKVLQDAIKNREARAKVYEKAAKDKAEGRLTDSQKMFVGCAAVAVVLGTAYVMNRNKMKNANFGDLFADSADEALNQKVAAGEKISKKLFMEKWGDQQATLFKPISQDAFDHLGTDDIRIDAGNVLKRVSKSDGTIIRGANQYVSFTEEDVERYKAILPTEFWTRKEWGYKSENAFVVSYEATNNIISPSARKRVEAFIELMNEKIPDTNTDTAKSGRAYVRKLVRESADELGMMDIVTGGNDGAVLSDISSFKSLSNEELGRRAYQIFATMELGNADSPLANAYIDKLKSMGYNAIVDDNDAGRLSDMPLLIFDAAKNLSWVGADKLAVEEIEKAGNNLVELLNRKE